MAQEFRNRNATAVTDGVPQRMHKERESERVEPLMVQDDYGDISSFKAARVRASVRRTSCAWARAASGCSIASVTPE